MLQLVDQGNVSLDDPIAKYLVGVPQGNRITLRQLARMQSGLYKYSDSSAFQQAYTADPRRHFSPRDLLGYAFAQSLLANWRKTSFSDFPQAVPIIRGVELGGLDTSDFERYSAMLAATKQSVEPATLQASMTTAQRYAARYQRD